MERNNKIDSREHLLVFQRVFPNHGFNKHVDGDILSSPIFFIVIYCIYITLSHNVLFHKIFL